MSQTSNVETGKDQKKWLDGQTSEHLNFLHSLGFLVDELQIGTELIKCNNIKTTPTLKPTGRYCYRTFLNELRSGGHGLTTVAVMSGEVLTHRTAPQSNTFFGLSPLPAMRSLEQSNDRQEQTVKELKRVGYLWGQARAPVKSLYLERKGLLPCEGVRFSVTKKHGSSLVIPIRDKDRTLRGLQFIGDDGSRRIIGRYKGYGFRIGSTAPDAIIAVCEGFATGLCLHRLLGMQVVCAFSACNISAVAQVLRDTRPSVGILVCGDNDRHLPRNEGLLSAERAARQVGGMLAIPNFGDLPASKSATDWLDLVRERGEDEARDQLINGCKIAKGVA